MVGKTNEIVRRNDATAKDIVGAIEVDPILAAMVLRQGAAAHCLTLDQVVSKVGAQKVRSLLAEACSHRVTESRDPKSAEATRLLWDHARAVAILAQNVAVLAGVVSLGLQDLGLHDLAGQSRHAARLLGQSE